jgi:hypothetical protein
MEEVFHVNGVGRRMEQMIFSDRNKILGQCIALDIRPTLKFSLFRIAIGRVITGDRLPAFTSQSIVPFCDTFFPFPPNVDPLAAFRDQTRQRENFPVIAFVNVATQEHGSSLTRI